MLYFAYGRNMNPEILQEKIGDDFATVGKGRVKGVRLVFHRPGGDGTGKADLQDHRGSEVEGAVYDIPDASFVILDRFQNVEGGLCRRQAVTVQTSRGELEAITYRANKFRTGLKPDPEYLRDLIAGAQAHRLSEEYISYLQSFDTHRS